MSGTLGWAPIQTFATFKEFAVRLIDPFKVFPVASGHLDFNLAHRHFACGLMAVCEDQSSDKSGLPIQ